MKHPEWDSEVEWLWRVTDVVRGQLDEALGRQGSNRSEVSALWRAVREETANRPTADASDDEWFLRSEIRRAEALHRNSADKAAVLARALETPYFGRVDFHEEGTDEPLRVYVGLTGVREARSPFPMVYDWRAPVSTLFYDADVGPASYACGAGDIPGRVTLKRQYGIECGRLVSMFDADLKIDDGILREALSRSASPQMRTIVQTIQRHQNRAIRDEGHRLLIVEGPAGSGKTSVALHRAAYLLYKDRDRSPGVLILSPNRVFSDYIARVLPELGEEGTEQLTFTEYADKGLPWGISVEGLSGQLDRLAVGGEGYDSLQAAIRVKGSLGFADAIEGFIADYATRGRVAREIEHNGTVLMTEEELAGLLTAPAANMPMGTRLNHIRARLEPGLKALMAKRRREIIDGLKDEPGFRITHEITAEARERLTREFEPLNAVIDGILNIDTLDVYRGFLKTVGLAPGLPLEPREDGGTVTLAYEDTAPILLMRGLLHGFASLPGITHCIIDEVQDYSPLQLRLLHRILPGRSFTLVGDTGQTLGPADGSGLSWTPSALGVPEAETLHVRFNKVYRSTREIALFAGALLGGGGVDAEPLDRAGDKPRVVVAGESIDALGGAVRSEILHHTVNGRKSIAVITASTHGAIRSREALEKAADPGQPIPHMPTEDEPGLDHPLVIAPIGLLKGLEFDAVILIHSQGSVDDPRTRKFLYTGCTRALHGLSVVTDDEGFGMVSGSAEPGTYVRV